MKYFFILGNHPTISIAELANVFSGNKKLSIINKSIALLEIKEPLDPEQLIAGLGGTIKIGQIIADLPRDNSLDILPLIKPYLKPNNGKYKYGFSAYGIKPDKIHALAMEIKNYLKEKKISSRWVSSRTHTLSSVIVGQNKLINKGIELFLIKTDKQVLVGRTLAVQPYKKLSERDYGRPARDDKSGMLPPKLAQIMINLSNATKENISNQTILDPFCGSGTILTEALLMGYKKIIGTDNSKKAIQNTEENIIWTKNKYDLADFNFNLYRHDATKLTTIIKPSSVDMIVTEPYLGPQRGKIEIKKIIPELNQLYSKALSEMAKVLKPSGRVVMIWPMFMQHKTRNTQHMLDPNTWDLKKINPIPRELHSNKYISLTPRNTIIYGRPNQRVWREIVVLKK